MKLLTLTLTAALTLAFSFTAVAPADAKLNEIQKCKMKANLLVGKFAMCLNKADANVSKGKATDTAAADTKCEEKFRKGWGKLSVKAEEAGAGDCAGAMRYTVEESALASALLAGGRNRFTRDASADGGMGDRPISTGDLLPTNPASGILALIDEANLDLGIRAGGIIEPVSNDCSVDLTSDNESLCTVAGGT